MLKGNRIESSDGALDIGIRIGEKVGEITLDGNTFEGVKTPLRDERQTQQKASA